MGDEQGRVHLMDALSGALEHDLTLHRNWCTALTASRDGALVASGSLDRTVKVVSTASGEVLGALELDEPVASLSFSPSGEQLAIGSTAGGVTVHDLLEGTVLFETSQEKRVTNVVFSPDGTHLVVGAQGLNGSQPTARVFRITDGEVVRSLSHGSVLDAFSFSADGKRLACGGLDPVTLVVDLADEDVDDVSVDVVTGSKVLALSNVNDLLVSAGRDGWLRMVDFSNDARYEAQVEHTMLDIDISGDGLELGIAYEQGMVELRSTGHGDVLSQRPLASDMTPISMTLVRGQRPAADVDVALPKVLSEIKDGGFDLDVPNVKADGEVWHLVVSASWAWN
jgi:hypothetical protein